MTTPRRRGRAARLLRPFALALVALALFASRAAAQTQPPGAASGLETAVFAGGCFWCMEHDLKYVPGVVSVESGYTGGHVENPTYEAVVTQLTGHYEAVRVTFDPARLSYERLLQRYWPLTDPTDAGGQFCDRGPSYRPAIFVTPAQRAAAERSLEAVRASGRVNGEIITPILDLGPFYVAEEYHRDYAARNAPRYARYRAGCGRDARLRQVWKPLE